MNNATAARRSLGSYGRVALRLAVSIFLLALVCSFIDLGHFSAAAARAHPQLLLSVVILLVLDRLLMAYKWNLLLRRLRVSIPLWRLYWSYSVAPLAGTVLPATLGGDLFRFWSIVRERISARSVLASMFIERLIGLVAMLLLAAIGLGVASWLLQGRSAVLAQVAWILCGSTVLTALLMVLFLHEGINRSVRKLAKRCHHLVLVRKLHQVYQTCRRFRNHRDIVLIVFGLTLVEQLAPVGINVLLVNAFEIDVSAWELLAIIPVIVLITRIPISVDGIGVQEGLYVLLFGLVGVPAPEAMLVSMAQRALILLCALPLGIAYLFRGSPATAEARGSFARAREA